MAKIRPHLHVGKTLDGLAPIYVRISHKGKESFVALGVKVREKGWNSRTLEVRKTHAGFYKINARLAEITTAVEEIAMDMQRSGDPFTASAVKAKYLLLQGHAREVQV